MSASLPNDAVEMPQVNFHFGWDPVKAGANLRKHGVDFSECIPAFHDPLAITRHHLEHGRAEERWITVGQVKSTLLVCVHTLEESDVGEIHVRIISARRPTRDERQQYESGRYRIEEPIMKREEEWVRGKFYRQDAVFLLPFHLEASVFARISRLAEDTGVPATELVGRMLTRAMNEMDETAAGNRG